MPVLFVVQFEDVYLEQPERLPERAQHMQAHLDYLALHGDQIIAAGALRPTLDGVPTGGIWIVHADSIATVDTLCRDDPFWQAGLRKSVRISHWAKAFWSPAFATCMAAFDDCTEAAPDTPGS